MKRYLLFLACVMATLFVLVVLLYPALLVFVYSGD